VNLLDDGVDRCLLGPKVLKTPSYRLEAKLTVPLTVSRTDTKV
jgi:hypothetical protein